MTFCGLEALPSQVEVMKMVMPLLAPASGVVSFVIAEGGALVPGTLIGQLNLDDPLAVVSKLGEWDVWVD
jgi:biotin carboxyl carrier protein